MKTSIGNGLDLFECHVGKEYNGLYVGISRGSGECALNVRDIKELSIISETIKKYLEIEKAKQ